MSIIAKLQQRDLVALSELNPDNDFDRDYLEHLQNIRHVLVAYRKDDEGVRTYSGYITILWTSDDTSFWRHNIPEIVDLYVAEEYRRQDIATELIRAIESAARKQGFSRIGIRIEPEGELAVAKSIFQDSGYKADEFRGKNNTKMCLVKLLA